MTAIRGAAAAITGAAGGIGRALALEMVSRGVAEPRARRPRRGRAEGGRRRDRQQGARSRRTRSMSASADADQGVRAGRDRRAPLAQHPRQQCRRGAARPVHRDRSGADGMADQHQFLGRGARHPRLPAASLAQREAHIVNLSSIFGIIAPPGQTAYCAAKFAVRGFSESLRHELKMADSPVRLLGGASRRHRHRHRAQLPHRQRHHRQCAAHRGDRPLRQGGEEIAGCRRHAHRQRHRGQQAADPDRQRRDASRTSFNACGLRPTGRCWGARCRSARRRRK